MIDSASRPSLQCIQREGHTKSVTTGFLAARVTVTSDQPLLIHHYSMTQLCMQFDPFAPSSLAAVNDDILWLDPFLQHTLFGMLPSTPEQPWRLNLKVANALFVVVKQTIAILIHNLLVGLFHNLKEN